MGVRCRTVPVQVLVDQVRPHQQVRVGQDRGRVAVRHDSALLAQDHGAVRDQRHDVELVRRDDERPAGGSQALDQIDQNPFRARVERSRRLVEQDNVRPQGEHRGDRRALLLAARKLEGRPIGQMRDLHRRQGLVAALSDLVHGEAQLQRPEGDVVEDRGAEELDVGVLEDEPDLAVES
jgi:hypothetical protein